jgi:hypothetical protein
MILIIPEDFIFFYVNLEQFPENNGSPNYVINKQSNAAL